MLQPLPAIACAAADIIATTIAAATATLCATTAIANTVDRRDHLRTPLRT